MQGRVLVVAGSDSGGGAGIQGDIKTITALGGYGATAITALTAQNTLGVFGIHEVPPAFIAQQMRLVLEDIGADCIKTGMLHNTAVIHTVADVLADYPHIPLVLDPVMVAKGGAPLLQREALEALTSRLIPRAMLITPNIPEAEWLLGCEAQDVGRAEMEKIARDLLVFGAHSVLLKGGHLDGEEITDVLINNSSNLESYVYTSLRIATRHTHGTGCTLASAIATGIAQGMEIKEAVKRARDYVHEAIRTAPQLGQGHGPLNHAVEYKEY